jgi:chromosomal replication initiation ATPase DnaA
MRNIIYNITISDENNQHYIENFLNQNSINFLKIEKNYSKIEQIVKICCDYWNIQRKDLFLKTRKQPFSDRRMIIVYFCDKYTGLPPVKVAYEVCHQDRSSVYYAKKAVKNTLSSIPNYKREILDLQSLIEKVLE